MSSRANGFSRSRGCLSSYVSCACPSSKVARRRRYPGTMALWRSLADCLESPSPSPVSRIQGLVCVVSGGNQKLERNFRSRRSAGCSRRGSEWIAREIQVANRPMSSSRAVPRRKRRRLRWPIGTVSGRLSRARDSLRGRLIRRGLDMTAGALGGILTSERASTYSRVSFQGDG